MTLVRPTFPPRRKLGARALARRLRWRAQRQVVERGHTYRAAGSAPRRMLFISGPGPIPRAQIYPFFFYRRAIRERFGVALDEVLLSAFEAAPAAQIAKVRADVVCVQTWAAVSDDCLCRVLERVRAQCRPRRVVLLDSGDSCNLRWAHLAAPFVDLYVKKHVLRDRAQYRKPTMGNSNLTDYYARRHGLSLPTYQHMPPDGFFEKLLVGPNLATAEGLLEYFAADAPAWNPKSHDVHARLQFEGVEWYAAMRRDALDSLRGIEALTGTGVPRQTYLDELSRSRICFSPFGHGEVCWRDYEAILCGALLLKPDTSHVETHPDVFLAEETYVPVSWDFSDVAEAVERYLDDPDACERIAAAAYAHTHAYFATGRFLDQMAPLFEA